MKLTFVLTFLCLLSLKTFSQTWDTHGNNSASLGNHMIGCNVPGATNDSLLLISHDSARLTIQSGGKCWFSKPLGIGTTKFGNYMLSVNGKARAREVVVNIDVWSDFVFDKNYQLPEISYVADFARANHHLPGVPTAKDVHDNGVSLGEMNKILLQKVEELTLYIDGLNKRITDLEAKNGKK